MQAPTPKLHIINTPELFDKLVEYFAQNVSSHLLVIDTETNSTHEKIAKLWGIGLCFNDKRGFYIVWRDKQGKEVFPLTYQSRIANWLLNLCKSKKVVGHNVLYDVLVLENNLDIHITDYIYADTLLMKHTCDEERPHGLKEVAKKEFGEWAILAEEKLFENIKLNEGKTTKDCIEYYKADSEILGEYCIWDCILTYLLFIKFEKQLADENLSKFFYVDEVMPLYKHITINMKRQGFPVDVAHFEKLQNELQIEINKLEDEILEEIRADVYPYVKELLTKKYPTSNAGNFPKAMARVAKIPLPINPKTNKISIADKELCKLQDRYPDYYGFYEWIKGNADLPLAMNKYIHRARELLFKEQNPEKKHPFNLRSNDCLSYWLFNVMEFTPVHKTAKKQQPKLDDDFFDTVSDENPIIKKLVTFKKLSKLQSTYVEGILERQIDGKIYTSMLQHGTTSGRYSSTNPNLQNIPRIKDEESELPEIVLKYTNEIKKGFIAPTGYKIVNADYSSLEPRCFAHMANEKTLQQVFIDNLDLYSQVAIDVEKLEGFSADKKNGNYLGKLRPELRQLYKTFCLAVVYGAEASRTAGILGVGRIEAQVLLDKYLATYPNLKKYMRTQDYLAKTTGIIKSDLGRVRHLRSANMWYMLHRDALMDYQWAIQRNLLKERRQYKTALNVAKNFPIQCLAASIINRSAVAAQKKFKEQGLPANIIQQVHDELTVLVPEEYAEQVKTLLKETMENTVKISVPLVAEPKIASNWAEAK